MSAVVYDQYAFEAWLKGHEPGATVGYAGQAIACPLANWIRITYQPDDVEVSVGLVIGIHRGSGHEAELSMTRWHKQFQLIIDLFAPYDDSAAVSAGQCLRVLGMLHYLDEAEVTRS
jgi:hypothetical protein